MADLSMFATKDNADDGVILPVKIEGIKFPIAIKLYGSDSDIVKDYEREQIRKIGKAKLKNKKSDEEELLDDYLDSSDENVLIRVGGVYSYDWKKKRVIENDPVILNGKTITNDRESFEFLLEKIPSIKDWITENSNERYNFLSNGKKN